MKNTAPFDGSRTSKGAVDFMSFCARWEARLLFYQNNVFSGGIGVVGKGRICDQIVHV